MSEGAGALKTARAEGSGRRISSNRHGGGGRELGATLLLVLVIAFVASALAVSFLHRADGAAEEAMGAVHRRQAFYAADGMGRILVQELETYLLENPNPSTADLQDPDNISPPEIEGFTLEEYDVRSGGDAFYGQIPNGPFEGMSAHLKPVEIDLLARRTAGSSLGELHLEMTIGQIGLFQFFVFGDSLIELFPGSQMDVKSGRIHANGDLCIGSSSTLTLDRLTASGRILASDSRCVYTQGNGAKVSTGSSYVTLNSLNSSGCTNCASSGVAWRSYALSTWKGFVRDREHGVTRLRLPLAQAPSVQAGSDAAVSTVSNASSSRVLVDPVLATDTADIREQKLAWKADLRIINGVWYINDGTWPGRPIWSDHPGRFTTKNEEGLEGSAKAVGQLDLAESLGWTAVPARFSYYEYDKAASRISGDARGVISYGSLAKSGSSWVPGFFTAGAVNNTWVDVDGTKRPDFCNVCNNAYKCSATLALRLASSPLCQYSTCVSTSASSTSQAAASCYQPLPEAQLLQGTRSGFVDDRVKAVSSSKGPILPINVDVAQLAAAMADTTPGELGSYFEGGRTFNGVIYITSSWPGAMGGMPGGLATLWPDQRAVTDATQPVTYGAAMTQRALPYMLCSDSLGYIPNQRRVGFSYPPSDGNASNGFEPVFSIPSCDSAISPSSRPSAVRLHNAATLDPAVFPRGLSIVTNLPLYLLGSFNSSSVTSPAGSSPWVPAMVGADAVTLLSDNWNDANAPWDGSVAFTSRVPVASRWNLCILSGNVPTASSSKYSGGIENFPRFLEKWSGATTTIVGAMVVGFTSVYQRQLWRYGSPVYEAPTRAWSYDPNLASAARQPPGTPRYGISAVSTLSRSDEEE